MSKYIKILIKLLSKLPILSILIKPLSNILLVECSKRIKKLHIKCILFYSLSSLTSNLTTYYPFLSSRGYKVILFGPKYGFYPFYSLEARGKKNRYPHCLILELSHPALLLFNLLILPPSSLSSYPPLLHFSI